MVIESEGLSIEGEFKPSALCVDENNLDMLILDHCSFNLTSQIAFSFTSTLSSSIFFCKNCYIDGKTKNLI